MSVFKIFPTAVAGLVAASCVTINVYFPAVAAERAADRIIEDVWGQQPAEDSAPEVAPEQRPTSALEFDRAAVRYAMRTLELLVGPAYAQVDFDISSPAIRNLTRSMEARHAELKPYFASGAIGLTGSGLIDVRDPNALPLAQRNAVRKLVADENADRNALYREIAVANKHPEWEAEIRQTFAKRWVDKAPSGWWYQSGGSWKRK